MKKFVKIDHGEYVEITERLVDKYLGQLPEKYDDILGGCIEGGEHGYAAVFLVTALVNYAVPVTAEEAADLRRVWYGTKRESGPEETIDRLTIVDGGSAGGEAVGGELGGGQG